MPPPDTLSHTRGLHTPGLPALTEVIGVERDSDGLQAPAVDDTKQSASFIHVSHVGVGLAEECRQAALS